MDLFKALILGIVEGVTEFLPISSTAHLILVSKLLNLPQTDFQKLFEVFIQGGAILAVIFIYSKYILNHQQLLGKIFFSFLPTAVVGFLFYKTIKNVFFESTIIISSSFFLLGIGFLLIEFLIKKKRIRLTQFINELSDRDAFLIGAAQSIAVVPGVSRAGIVLIIMMVMGYKRDEAAVYSFLLAVPTILAASFFDLYQSREIVLSNLNNLWVLLFGFGIAFIFAYWSVRWLIGYLQKHRLTVFGIYRMIIALLLFML